MSTPSLNLSQVPLREILSDAHDGRIALPEFQRQVTWTEQWVRSLVASVSLGHPIGAVTLLEAGSPDLKFDTRPLTGAFPAPGAPQRLLIDGQQRVTVLYQLLSSGRATMTHDENGQLQPRWFYVDLRAALTPGVDRDEAIVSVPEDRNVIDSGGNHLDLHTSELEWERGHFPLRLIFGDAAELLRWRRGFAHYGDVTQGEVPSKGMEDLASRIVAVFNDYLIPVINLGLESTRWAVRVHGGPEGPVLSDRFMVHKPDPHSG